MRKTSIEISREAIKKAQSKIEEDEAKIAEQEEKPESFQGQLKRVLAEEGMALNIGGQDLVDPKMLALIESRPSSEGADEIKACAKHFVAMLETR